MVVVGITAQIQHPVWWTYYLRLDDDMFDESHNSGREMDGGQTAMLIEALKRLQNQSKNFCSGLQL